jgi:hypothetical protein
VSPRTRRWGRSQATRRRGGWRFGVRDHEPGVVRFLDLPARGAHPDRDGRLRSHDDGDVARRPQALDEKSLLRAFDPEVHAGAPERAGARRERTRARRGEARRAWGPATRRSSWAARARRSPASRTSRASRPRSTTSSPRAAARSTAPRGRPRTQTWRSAPCSASMRRSRFIVTTAGERRRFRHVPPSAPGLRPPGSDFLSFFAYGSLSWSR